MLFEILWFRQAGWIVGNTVWASSIVLAAFMSGLALGNIIVLRFGARWRQPLKLYIWLEAGLAIAGLGLVLLLPMLPELTAAFWSQYAEQTALLIAFRFAMLFTLLLLPTLIMGLTLALVARALAANELVNREGSRLGAIVGRLYAMNTAGAVLAALTADGVLVANFGVLASGVIAASCNLLAAALMYFYVSSQQAVGTPAVTQQNPAQAAAIRSLLGPLLLAFATGALLLGLEVLWFRLLLLFGRGTDAAFGLMLATVLAGLAIGSASLGFASKRFRQAGQVREQSLIAAPFVLLIMALAGYFLLSPQWARSLAISMQSEWLAIGLTGLLLMLPASICSGWLFAALAGHIRQRLSTSPTTLAAETELANRAVAWLSISNTAGAAAAALLVGLVVLPTLGIQHSLLLLLALYALVAALWSGKTWPIGAALVCLVAITPLLNSPRINQHMDLATRLYRELDNAEVVWRKEGLNETVQLLERRLLDRPWQHRLMTDGYSMTNTAADSQRYMRLFAYLPAALMQRSVDQALLISYGVGSTADALQKLAPQGLTVVDVSKEIAELSSKIHPEVGSDPLARVNTQLVIEDGRQFLLRTKQTFDLITGEPPPPRLRRIESLYSQEYFQLLASRLNAGGMASYWLPVDQLERGSAAAIFNAFCSAFEHCSLWAGSQYNWIMLGAKSAADLTTAPWQAAMNNPQIDAESLQRDLASIAIANPQQLYASYIGEQGQLETLFPASAALTDNYPGRLSKRLHSEADLSFYYQLMDDQQTAARFLSSQVAKPLSADYRAAALAWFPYQPLFNQSIKQDMQTVFGLAQRLIWLNRGSAAIPIQSQLQTPLLWVLGSDQRAAEIVIEATHQADWPSRWQGLSPQQLLDYWWQQAAVAMVSGEPMTAVTAYKNYFSLVLDQQAGARPGMAGTRFEAGLAGYCLALLSSSANDAVGWRQLALLRQRHEGVDWPSECER